MHATEFVATHTHQFDSNRGVAAGHDRRGGQQQQRRHRPTGVPRPDGDAGPAPLRTLGRWGCRWRVHAGLEAAAAYEGYVRKRLVRKRCT